MPMLRKTAAAAGLTLACLAVQGCATPSRSRMIAEPRCVDTSVQIYFGEESAQVPRAGQRVISKAVEASKGCAVAAVNVVGLADYRGAPDANLALSRRRAEAVAQALSKAGLPEPQFRVRADGESGALTSAGQVEPLHRRADVYIRYTR